MNNLEKILANKTTNFDILFIVQAEFYAIFKKRFCAYKNIFIRKVKRFTEIPDAINEKVTDNTRWKKILNEFQPLQKISKTKIYKYEKGKKEYKLFEKIFSVKNFNKHKVFNLCGIKLKMSENKINKIKTLLQNIFSIKNENVHKVVRILGVKLKFKNYKAIANKKNK